MALEHGLGRGLGHGLRHGPSCVSDSARNKDIITKT